MAILPSRLRLSACLAAVIVVAGSRVCAWPAPAPALPVSPVPLEVILPRAWVEERAPLDYTVWVQDDAAPAEMRFLARGTLSLADGLDPGGAGDVDIPEPQEGPAPGPGESIFRLLLPLPASAWTGGEGLELVVAGREGEGTPERRIRYRAVGEGESIRWIAQAEAAPAPQAAQILAIRSAVVYPNPFNPFREDVTISYELSEAADVEISVYDWSGGFVGTVFRGLGNAGVNTVPWGGQTEDGRRLGNGVYLVRIVAANGARQEPAVVRVALWNE